MLRFKEYIRPSTAAEAFELNKKRSNRIAGGMMWLRLSRGAAASLVDLGGLGLDCIHETDTSFEIGAMTSLRSLEIHEGFNSYTNGAVKDCLSPIVGVQFRNTATVGGTVWGRYGFSDLITLLLALDAKVELYGAGIVSLADFIEMKRDRDILLRVIVEKKPIRAAYLSVRNSKTDFPVLTCTAVLDGDVFRCAIGARPGIAKTVIIPASEVSMDLGSVCREAAEKLKYGSNIRAGADYRRHLGGVLLRRGIEKIMKGE